MIDLRESLSEYSYGFGATMETLALLQSVGAHAAPYLPNLVHEKEVGFDVAFHSPGTVLMLQFKLGYQLGRFVRQYPSQAIPPLKRPFWRFGVDVDGHQFRRLRSWEILGADVYYVAPRFSNWTQYSNHFLAQKLLDHSLLMTPDDIHTGAGGVPGRHRIAYDKASRFVCSEPHKAPERRAAEIIETVRARTEGDRSLGDLVKQMANADTLQAKDRSRSPSGLPRGLADRLRANARSGAEGDAAVVAAEAWSQGAQVLFVGAPTVPAV